MIPSTSKPTSSSNNANVSPFARALAEAKAGSQGESFSSNPNQLNNFNPDQLAEQQRFQAEKMKRDRLREQLHRQINPVEVTDIFSGEKQRVKKELESIRIELKNMVLEFNEVHEEIEISIMQNIPDAGTQGKYYFNFFEKLKSLIQLLRQQIHSAHTWATTLQSKKKKQKGRAGLDISGQQYEQTTAVFDRMHHERSTQYSGS